MVFQPLQYIKHLDIMSADYEHNYYVTSNGVLKYGTLFDL